MKPIMAGVLLAMSLAQGVAAHRLDEYLQATLIGVTRNHVELEVSLTPGVAVLPAVMARIDKDADGWVSPEEEQAYVREVVRDVELRVDGNDVPLQMIGSEFPSLQAMREGLGTIRLNLRAAYSGHELTGHELRFENRHMPGVSVYLVNCLASRDTSFWAGSPERDEAQRSIRFRYSFAATNEWPASGAFWMAEIGILSSGRLAWRLAKRGRRFSRVRMPRPGGGTATIPSVR